MMDPSASRVVRRFAASAPVPYWRQVHPGLCGPACLRAVLLSYGTDVSESELVRLSGADKAGCTSEGLVRAAGQHGFSGVIKEDATFVELCNLVAAGTPVIVGWTSPNKNVDTHYSVVMDANDKTVTMMDPELDDYSRVTADDFQSLWFEFEDVKQQTGLHRHEMLVFEPSR